MRISNFFRKLIKLPETGLTLFSAVLYITGIATAAVFAVVLILIAVALGLDYAGTINFARQFWEWIFIGLLLVLVVFGLVIGIFMGGLSRKIRDMRTKLDLRGNFEGNAEKIKADDNWVFLKELNLMDDEISHNKLYISEQAEILQRFAENEDGIGGANAGIEERRKIARELHDSVSQELFALSATLAATKMVMDKDIETVARLVDNASEITAKAQQELRALIMHLRPVNLESKRLNEGLENFLAGLRSKTPEISVRGEIECVHGLSPGVENTLFRVVQEAVSNILRHANANSFVVKLFERDKSVNIIIEDNGKGFDVNSAEKKGYGLSGMRERVVECGGMMEVISVPGRGTRIHIRIRKLMI